MTNETGTLASLEPGEHLLWSGRPNPWRFAHLTSATPFAIGAIFFGVAVSILVTQPSNAWFALPAAFMGIPPLLMPLWQLFRGTRVRYALTDRRAIIDYAGPWARSVSVPLHQMKFVEVAPAGRASGSILFKDLVVAEGDGTSIRREGFIAIADAEQVAQTIRAATTTTPPVRQTT